MQRALTEVEAPVGKMSFCTSHSYALNGIGMRRGAQYQLCMQATLTEAYPCSLKPTHAHRCLPMLTDAYPCSLMPSSLTEAKLCSLKPTHAH